MTWIGGQRYLSYEEALNNMNIAYPILKKDGWTDEAIFGWSGNAWRESHVNPKLIEFSGGGGGGIVQWTPWSKHVNWANQRGIDPFDGDGQMKHIIYEKDNNIQWFDNPISTVPYISWKEFTKLKDIDVAVKSFMYFYEHPGHLALEERLEYAHKFAKDVKKTGGGGDGYQLAVLPTHGNVVVTQAEGGNVSHMGSLSLDLAYSQTKVPLYTPFDMVCMDVDHANAFTVWQSEKEVKCADGSISWVTFNTGHSDDFAKNKKGDKKKKGEIYAHTGISGNVTGDHTHIECSKAKYTSTWYTNPAGNGSLPNPAHMYDVFSSCDNVTKEVINITNQTSTNLPFKCILDWVDGDGGGTKPDKKNNFLIPFLMLNTLNGWYN